MELPLVDALLEGSDHIDHVPYLLQDEVKGVVWSSNSSCYKW